MRHWLFAAASASACVAQAAPPEWVAAKVVQVEPGRFRATPDDQRIVSTAMAARRMPFRVVEAMEKAK